MGSDEVKDGKYEVKYNPPERYNKEVAAENDELRRQLMNYKNWYGEECEITSELKTQLEQRDAQLAEILETHEAQCFELATMKGRCAKLRESLRRSCSCRPGGGTCNACKALEERNADRKDEG